MCTFWLVEALTRAGRTDRHGWTRRGCSSSRCSATPTTSACTPRRPARSGEALGNFPQAFTHLALISAAFNLDRALGAANLRRRAGAGAEKTRSSTRPSSPATARPNGGLLNQVGLIPLHQIVFIYI